MEIEGRRGFHRVVDGIGDSVVWILSSKFLGILL